MDPRIVAAMDAKALASYLRDHQAAAYAGIDLFDQVDSRHARADIRAAVARFRVHAGADLEALNDVMERVGVRPSLRKQLIVRYWQLARQVVTGVRLSGRRDERDARDEQAVATWLRQREQIWSTLVGLNDPRLDAARLTDLGDAARRDGEELERLREQPHEPVGEG